MSEGVKTIIFPVTDLTKAISINSAVLGVQPYLEKPYYAGFRIGEQEIGLDPNGHIGKECRVRFATPT